MLAQPRPRFRTTTLALASSFALASCADAPTAVLPSSAVPDQALAAKPGAGAFWDSGSSLYWNQTARELLATTPTALNVVVQARLFTYLSIAQYNAVVAAESAAKKGDHPSPVAAAAAASARVLKVLLPTVGATVDARFAQQMASEGWPSMEPRDVELGLAIGDKIGVEVLTHAATDRVGLTPAPAKPTGAGTWTGGTSVTTLFGARWFVVKDTSEFMPPRPPQFGSPAFQTALAEVKSIASSRTAEQIALAQFWNPRNGAAMNEVAAGLSARYRQNERAAARTLALANIAAFDALNACFVAKFAYYYIRPTQADPSITFVTDVPLPNHPAYPSGHSCIVGAFTGVLAKTFPGERKALNTMMERAGESRIVAALHYRFDVEAGQYIGRKLSALTLAAAPKGRDPIVLR